MNVAEGALSGIHDSLQRMRELAVQAQNGIYSASDKEMIQMEIDGLKQSIQDAAKGTDGARLSYEGLPCPNIFTGGENFHGRFEYVPAEDMEKCVELLLEILRSAE